MFSTIYFGISLSKCSTRVFEYFMLGVIKTWVPESLFGC